jgi:hypothetical protein
MLGNALPELDQHKPSTLVENYVNSARTIRTSAKTIKHLPLVLINYD